MELINQTPMPANLVVGRGVGSRRRGVLIVKATYRLDVRGFDVDLEAPHPVLKDDVETELGLVPSDLRFSGPRDELEVLVLGAAYPAAGERACVVELRIGELRRRLHVSGERFWVGRGADAVISEPQPFARMPLTWERAFGGTADVQVDASARVPVSSPLNPRGMGFDAERWVDALVAGGMRDPSLPRAPATRRLPNVEHPDDRVASWDDEPLPYCWATLPIDSGLREQLRYEARQAGRTPPRELSRAHPDLTMPAPAPGTPIELRGCTPSGAPFAFRMPASGVRADYAIGARAGTLELRPQTMVLMPEEQRVTVTFRAYFRFDVAQDEERSMRLRTV